MLGSVKLVCLLVVVGVSAEPWANKMVGNTKLIDMFSYRALFMMPQSVKNTLKQFTLKDVQDLKKVVQQLPQATSLPAALQLVETNSPKVHQQIKSYIQTAQEKFVAKKKELSPDAIKFFDDLENVMADSMKKSAKIIANINPKTKASILKAFPHLEEALNTPAAKNALQDARVALAV
ncbi:unnamed protein product [Bursaphelenchus xylophilus]|uniref:(pine wood nematode) hypothetical protein n=1 Tax=Bursaphelenchus xylophilus TaxID=6326 RepID=A0A1I7RQE5_BURXY|nr:unnamed protein product [Bursaphelenchus xylophilus]CAG9104456.1 unnamed protein product [Bursaphelenchus xylophilus]